ncbi:hypothetical protein [Streptomyces iconiensis]|uniref:FHA domain-containing protein n=1 Tax=Streptomyces iconiensis TaxID=1384038 RepID=A0ABT7A3U7_9ACTN|nr:hypothetical protein [Streptomyces iconiensis]MDJ1135985.1 hypothetical protein [Streptomyces iconiensis]
MFSVIIIPDGCRKPEGQHRLEPGQTLRFGRTAPPDTALTVAHPGVAPAAGEITATRAFWILTNFSRDQTYVVRNPEGAGERIRVAPGRADAPVPFEFARVTLRADGRSAGFDVLAPRHDYLAYPESPGGLGHPEGPGTPGGAEDCVRGGRSGARGRGGRGGSSGDRGPWEWREEADVGPDDPSPLAFPLDRTRRYFLVLAALCEPRLRGGSCATSPTVEQLVGRLRPVWPGVKPAAVAWNIDYLGLKLRLPPPGNPPGARPDGRFADDALRESLVAHALRFDLVREDHLRVLDGQLV